MYVNLLPQRFICRLALRRQARRWGIAVALALVICGGVIAVEYVSLLESRRAQAVTAFRSKELHAVQANTERMLAEAKTIASAIAELNKSRTDDRTLALLGIASASTQKLSGKVLLRSLTTQMATPAATPAAPPVSPGGPAKKSAPNAPETVPEHDLVLEGNADDAAAIASFIEFLRETGVFTRVDLTATSEAAGMSGAQRQFRVDCKF